jgi:putative membrane protein
MMTTIETPPPAAPEPAPRQRHSGFYVSPWVLAVLGGLVLLAVGFVLGRAVDRGDHHGRGFFRGGDGGGHPGLRLLVVLIVLALIVTVIVLLVRHFTAPRHDAVPVDTASNAEQVLADRFARGEIDEAEFVSRRNALRT